MRAAQQDFPVKVREQKDGRLIANFQGTSRLIFGQEEAMGLRLQLDGKTVVLPSIFDPRWGGGRPYTYQEGGLLA